jgi:hypothetical protein
MADFDVYVPQVRNDRGIIGLAPRDFLASDIRAINKALIAIDPELRTQFMRDAKAVGKEAQSIVQPALPTTAPLSGMNFRGRYGWDTQMTKKGRVPANRVSVSFKTSQGKNAKRMGLQTTSLVSVRVAAPMTAIIDIAGRSGNSLNKGDKGSGYSRPYTDRYGNIRTHKLNGQGKAMIELLGGRGSRYAWPAFESSQGRLSNSVLAVVERYAAIANRKFK